MTYKKISFADTARNELADGVEKLADAVTATLGPSGRNVIIEQEMGMPSSTKDGVTVARSIELKNKVENLGAQIVKQAAIKTAEQAGDGTTTSTLLAQSILNEGLERMNAGSNAVDIKRGIDEAVQDISNFLSTESKEITDEEQLKQVATISANNDNEVGELISTAMDKVGRDGVVTIEESKTGETYLETVEGMQFNRGYKSPYFVTDNNSMTAVLQDPLILITDKRLNSVKELLPILEGVSQQSKSLLVIADDIDGEALSTMVVNKMRGILPVVAVKAPEFGDRKKAMLEDIAVLTNGQVISTEKGMRLDKFQSEWLGKANKITVTKDTCTIIDAKGTEEAIDLRVNEIRQQIEDTNSTFEKEKLQDRLAAFIGGVAIVHVGGNTEVEMKEKKDRVEDALHATKAALEEGILPGGGIALLNGATWLTETLQNELDETPKPEGDKLTGYDIIINACERPFYKILENAGYSGNDIGEIEEYIKGNGEFWFGYNPREEDYFDMFKEGIIDPTKVTRLALENAASVAGTLLITEAVVSKGKDKKDTAKGADPSMLLG
jgi:chaperonin GroEL|tara:strand:- start:356 stop:2017 length:1662 start_codon:yes stop_codon:yes gene_type:complete